MTKTLFQIGDDIRALEQILYEMEGDVSDADIEAAIDQWFQENQNNLETKVDGYCTLIREREAMAKARQEEAQRLTALAQSDLALATRLKTRLKSFFEQHAMTKLETTHHRLSIARNGGLAPLVLNPEWLANPANAPERFHKVKIELDKEAIRDVLDLGEQIEGAELGERGTHLRIK